MNTPPAALLAADYVDHHPWALTVDGVDLLEPGPVLAAQGRFAMVPIIAGATRDDLSTQFGDMVVGPVGPMPVCANQVECTEKDFRSFARETLGLNAFYEEELVSAPEATSTLAGFSVGV